MTVIYRSQGFNNDPTAAGSHVVAIGVGHYDYLPKGRGGRLAPVTLGLKQLDSPPISVRAFCDWLLRRGEYAAIPGAGLLNPDAPLATVDLLVSPQGSYDPGGGSMNIEYPTVAAIRAATAAWYARCNANPANVGMFYFCGHGVELTSSILVSADFGGNQADHWEGLFNITATAFFARKSRARTMCFFVDACREFSNELAKDQHGSVPSLLQIPAGAIQADRYLFLPANGLGLPGFAEDGKVSLYTAALISAFHEHGAKGNLAGDGWCVTNASLATGVRGLLQVQEALGFQSQVPPPSVEREGLLHVLSEEPKVPVFIDCDPEAARPHTDYRLDAPKNKYKRAADVSPWSVSVAPGIYTLQAQCGQPYVSKTLNGQIFAPPEAHFRRVKVS